MVGLGFSRKMIDPIFRQQVAALSHYLQTTVVILGMTNIAIENGHRNSGFTHETWWFSIAKC